MAAFDPTAGFATTASQDTAGPTTGGSASRQPLAIQPTFCPVEVESPFETSEWELRTAAFKGVDG